MKVQFYSIVLFSVIINSNFLFAQVTINDAFFNNQWYLNMQGNDNTRADIRILDAWSRTMGSSIQKIADIEDQASGFPNSSHEDLINRINVHGIGTDGEHATQIAGILVANHNNKGIAGINKFASLNSYIFSSTNNWADWDDRILDAISDGNKIINISQGTYARLPDVSIKLAQAYSNNIVTVVSAGNNNSSLTNPAKNLSVIAVGASTKDNTRASWSNFGPQIEFLAPGGSVLNDPLNDKNIYTTSLDGSYKYSSGTSMAAPIVTGATSLLLAYKPSLSNEDVKNILRYSCDKLPQMQGADFTDECGYGRINLKKAMQFLEAPYTIYHGNAILTKLYDNIGMSFTNDPILPFGIYYGDAYKLSIDRDDLNYLEIPMAWLPKGYSPYFPNNSQDYLNSTISSNSIHLSTFFYYIEHDEVGNLINMWVPYNPPLIYTILGKPLVAPVIANITQNPVPIYKGTYGYVYCNLSQGNGNLTYNWFSYDQPSYVSIVPEGNRCKIIYHNTESMPPIDAPAWNFGCTVSNAPGAGWSDTEPFVPSLNSDPNGCPTLAFDNRGTLISENPLLITSMSNPAKMLQIII